MASVQDEIAELDKRMKLIMPEKIAVIQSIAVERDIQRVLGLLIARDGKNSAVYQTDIAASKEIESQLLIRSGSLQDEVGLISASIFKKKQSLLR